MTIDTNPRAGFAPGTQSQRARRRRSAILAQLVAGSALVASLTVTLIAVSIGIARAAPTIAAVNTGTGEAVLAFLIVIATGFAGLTAFAVHERRLQVARRRQTGEQR